MIKIKNKEDCTGCSACANICPKQCITMIPDNEGFVYPEIDKSLCVDCDSCIKVCPIINYQGENHPISILGLKNKNKQKQIDAASGGVFTELAEYIIKEKGFVVGAVWNDDFSVSHQICDKLESCSKFRGSKYQQSKIGTVYLKIKEILIQGTKVLFSGTPCQVAGLKKFLRKPYSNLYTCDLICHGVTSPKVFQSYIQHIESKYKRTILSINMRDKTLGWDASGIRIRFSDGSSIFKNKDTNLFNCMYSVHYATRPSCHHCVFTNFQREGDITIGDFWTIKQWHPDFFDKRGVSVAIINATKGKELFRNIDSKFQIVNSSMEECLQNNLYKSAQPSTARNEFFEVYLQKGYEYAIRQFMDYGYINQVKQFARRAFHKLHLPIPSIIKSTIRK